MRQIAVGVFDVHKIKTGFLSINGGFVEMFNGLPDLSVGNNAIRSAVEFFVQQRMGVCCAGFQFCIIIGVGKTPGVSQLQADAEIVCRSEFCGMDLPHFLQQTGDFFIGGGGHGQLPGVAFCRVHDRTRFHAEEQFGAALRKMQPAAAGQFAGGPVRLTIPPFHRQDRPAVANGHAHGFMGLAQFQIAGQIRAKRNMIRLFLQKFRKGFGALE